MKDFNFTKAWQAETANRNEDKMMAFAYALCNSVAVAVADERMARYQIRRELLKSIAELENQGVELDLILTALFFPNNELFMMTFEALMDSVTVDTVYDVTLLPVQSTMFNIPTNRIQTLSVIEAKHV